MAQMTYGESGFGIKVPCGWYLAKFVGTEDRAPMKESRYGQGGQPRMAWVFKVTEGEKAGETIAQETGTAATPKSNCAKIIAGLAGGKIAVGEVVNTDQYVGKVYRLKVAPNPDSDQGRPHVADIESLADAAGSAAQTAPPPRTNNGPPPRRPQPANDAAKFWLDKGDGTESLVSGDDVRHFIFEKGRKAADVMVCPEGGSEWSPAVKHGFEDSPIPA